MDIRNVGRPGDLDRPQERSQRAEQRPAVLIPAAPRDGASISAASRVTAAAIEGLAERARGGDGDREAIVAAAVQKLQSGGLDTAEAFDQTARRLLDGGFRAG